MSFIDKIRNALIVPILVAGGALVIYGGVDEAATSKAIADHGKTTKAQVESIEWKEKGWTKREKNFKAIISFETEDKTSVTTTVSLDKALGQAIRDDKAESVIEVKYLPENPQKVVMADHEDSSMMMYAIGAAMILIGVGVFIYRRRKGALAASPA